jgi:hypothetical protein
MTFDESMHAVCDWCGEMAMHHRMTDSGNFYCLEPAMGRSARWMRSTTKRWGVVDARLWAQNKASCSDLKKSPLPKEVGKVIVDNWRTLPSPTFEQMELG